MASNAKQMIPEKNVTHQKSRSASLPEPMGKEKQGEDFILSQVSKTGRPLSLPPASGNPSMNQAQFKYLQKRVGNQAIQQLWTGIQRQDLGTGANALPEFALPEYSREFSRFDCSYLPLGPIPQVGTLTVSLKVYIIYKPFTKAIRQKDYKKYKFTAEQLADITWKDDEKEKFQNDFSKSVSDGWSNKFPLSLKEPGFSEYRANVNIQVIPVNDPTKAHMKITAQKVPKGAPRFRSRVKGKTAILDINAPSERQTGLANDKADFITQVGPFIYNSFELTAPIKSQLERVKTKVKPLLAAIRRPDEFLPFLSLTGRASSQGSMAYNEKLAGQRSNAVGDYLESDLGAAIQIYAGERNATVNKKFRRVDVQFSDPNRKKSPLSQNTAAHEAGHMFGLGDEYVEEKPEEKEFLPKFVADKPTHYGAVKTLLGTEAADDLLVQNSGSIMSHGDEVKPGHYAPFLAALKIITGKTWKAE